MKPPTKLPSDEILDREPLVTAHGGRAALLEHLRLGQMAPTFGHGLGLVAQILVYLALFLILVLALL
jgi:hypothetical protein